MKGTTSGWLSPVIYIGGEQHTDLQASRSNRRWSMFYAGIDAHMKSSTIWIVDRKGRKVSSSTVMTSAEGFAAGLGRWVRRGLKAAIEASGITPWVCQLLKDLGVRVVVVNPNRVRLIAESRKKADRVDAETLAELLRLDLVVTRPRYHKVNGVKQIVPAPEPCPYQCPVSFEFPST